MQDINDKVLKCLTTLNLNINECKIISINCEGVGEVNDAGVYILLNGNDVLYVGEANNIARRVGKEHCKARIGASEGVARFLVYLLDKICARRSEWVNYGVVNREKYIVEEVLMPVITKLTILVITCPQLKDLSPRHKLEKCLMEELKPILQT
jgi:hypothetical protein